MLMFVRVICFLSSLQREHILKQAEGSRADQTQVKHMKGNQGSDRQAGRKRQDTAEAAKIDRKMLTNGRSQICIIPSLVYVFNTCLD